MLLLLPPPAPTLDAGKRIFDIGAKDLVVTSENYQAELKALAKAGFQRVKIGAVTVKERTFRYFRVGKDTRTPEMNPYESNEKSKEE